MSGTLELELIEVREGTRLRLRVKPGGRRNAVVGPHGGALKVTVAAAPERGKANRAVIELLARALDLPASAIEILSGETSPDKTVLVRLSPAEVSARLAARA
jgi:uncharacterized protein (TIGR00251 family)